MTPSQIETAARRLLNATGSNFWSSDEIIGDHLYFAALEMAQETFCIENRYTTTTVADQQEYATPSRMIAIKRIEYDSQKLRPISLTELDSIDTNTNTTVTGTPQYYYHFDDAFGLYPAPAEGSKTITIYSYDEPDVPTSTSTLEIPTQFHQYLVIGTAFYMSMKELGHPHVGRFELMWNAGRNNAIDKVRRAVRMRNKDQFATVLREENQPSTHLGMI
jgi:hypothetical protein